MYIENSKRLSYRLMTLDDGRLLYELDQDPQVMKYISGGILTTMESIQNVMLPRLKAYLNAEKGWGIWQVNRLNDKQYIGWILVRPLGFFTGKLQADNLELGWRFKAHSWGQGYASEAADHVLQSFAKHKKIKRFSAIADPNNLASIKVMKKIKMTYIKTFLNNDPLFSQEVAYYERNL